MAIHLQRDLEHLKREILTMGALVEDATDRAIVALVDRRPELAAQVQRGDDAIDQKEVEIEEDCLKMLALHQPVASNLRFIITVLKVNNDLERMGDCAAHIAERAAFLATHPPIGVPLDFQKMAERVRGMVRKSLDALVRVDTGLARAVCDEDDFVDAAHRALFGALQDLMRRDPDAVERCVNTLSASRNLERIADLATNIAEDVIFLVEGRIVRHRYRAARGDGAGPTG